MPKQPQSDVYEVEVVLAARVNDEGGWDYLVKWWGYPESDNSWEPEGNIHQCERLLGSFWDVVGRNDDDHPIGYQVQATRQWIRREKQYFARVFAPHDNDTDEEPQTPRKSNSPTKPGSNKKAKQTNSVYNIQPRTPKKLKSPIKLGSSRKTKQKETISESSDFDHIRAEPKKRLTITIPARADFVASTATPTVTKPESSTSTSPPVSDAVEPDNIEDPPSSPDSLFSKVSSGEVSPSVPQLEVNPVEDRFFTHRSPKPMAAIEPPDLDNVAQANLMAEIEQRCSHLHKSNGDNPIQADISEIFSVSSVSDESVVRDISISPVLRRATPATPLKYPIPKKWKWTGALLVNTGGAHAKRLSVVCLTDITANPPNRLSFDTILPSADSIEITRMLNIADLDPLFSACGALHQVAKLAAEDINDRASMDSLASFMDDRRQVAVGPLFFENKEIAYIIIFPSSLATLWPRFNIQDGLRQTGQFIAALIPWTMTPAEYFNYGIRSSLVSFMPPEFKHTTSQAIQCLKFPPTLREYMRAPYHPYVVWWSPSDGTASAPGLETTLLLKILKACRAQKVEADDNKLRVVFVHVGALDSLHRLSTTLTRRRQQPEIHFFSYGSHPSVPSEQWGVRAIYPLGGIVTFTADALLEDPIGAAQLMSQIAMHPFWDCYLLPSAVGMAVRFLCEGEDPLLEFQAGHLILDDIFRLMADGQVALLRAPHGRGAGPDWVHWQLSLFASTPSDLLEECLEAFSAQYANTPDGDLFTAIHTEIAEDLLSLQSSPSITENYRQYVVIKATSTGDCSGKHGGLVEWTTLDDFDTQDGFLQTPKSLLSV